jgi:hypothetical protein
MGVVRAHQDPFDADEVLESAEVVLVERGHPDVTLEGLARVFGIEVRHLPEGFLELLVQVEDPVGAGLDDGNPEVGETVKQPVRQQVGQGVLRRVRRREAAAFARKASVCAPSPQSTR